MPRLAQSTENKLVNHVARVLEMVARLENHGVHVRMITGERLGYVVYEDEYQLVAEPFASRRR